MSNKKTATPLILAIVLLIFGGTKLPKLARSLGEAKKEFESSSNDDTTTTVTKVVETKEIAEGDKPA